MKILLNRYLQDHGKVVLLMMVVVLVILTEYSRAGTLTCYNTKSITMKFKSSVMGQTCDGSAACFSKQVNRLETTFIVPGGWQGIDLTQYNIVAASGSLSATGRGIFNPCLSDESLLNSTSSFYVNGQPVFVGRKNLGQDFVTYECAPKQSCPESFSADSNDIEYPYTGFFNLTSSGNTAVYEYSDPLADLCLYDLEFTFCPIPKSYIIYDFRLKVDDIDTKPLKFISASTIESLKNDVIIPPQAYDPLQNGYSDKYIRKIRISNKALQTGNVFYLKISPINAYTSYPLVVSILSITKEKTVSGNVINQDISGEYQISNTSLSNYKIKFNTSLSVEDSIIVEIMLSVNSISSSAYDMNMNYQVDVDGENRFNLRDTTTIDSVYFFTRSEYLGTYDANQKITAKSLISDTVSLEYVSESQEDGKCYLQVNTIYGTSSDNRFNGLLFVYSSKTGKQYSTNVGQDYVLDKISNVGQYIIPPELLDCSHIGAKTNIYFKWVILNVNSYSKIPIVAVSFQINISKKNIIFVNDLSSTVPDITFSKKYESSVILLKSNPPNEIFPYDVTLKNSYASSESPFSAYLSYSVPLSWMENSPMALNPVNYPQSSTDFTASEIYLRSGMYFSFVEKSCNVLPCIATISFKVNGQFSNPPSLSVNTPVQVSQKGYRANGYITAVSIPASLNTRVAGAPKYTLRVLAEVKETHNNPNSAKNPYYLQASKGYVGMNQNPPYNSTYEQQISSQNYLSTDKCFSTSITSYITVNVPIRDASDFGTWYIAFFVDPNSSFDVKYTISLMSSIIPLKVATDSSKAILGYPPISAVIYGLELGLTDASDSSLLLSFDGYNTGASLLEGSGIKVFLKHGSMPTESDYEVVSPVITGSFKFVARFVYSEKVTFRYLMDNSYYSDPIERSKYPVDMYNTAIISNSKLDNGILYVMLKRVPTGGVSKCITYYHSTGDSYINYQYSSSQSVNGGYLEKMKSQVISVNPDFIGKNLGISNGNDLMIDFNQETVLPQYFSRPIIVSYDGKKLETLLDQNSTTLKSDSISVSAHSFSYYMNGKIGDPTVSFRYSINTKLKIDEKSGKYAQQLFIILSLQTGVITAGKYDTIVKMNSKFEPSTYLIESLTPSIITTAIVVGISFIISCLYFIWSVFIIIVKRGEFNFGTVSSQMWLGCLCPASLPVSVCYLYYFSHESFQNKLVSPSVKRMRRTRILMAIAIISFSIGLFFGLYLYGHVVFNYVGLELSANSNLYTLGKHTTDSTYSASNLIPCCAQTRAGSSKEYRTYFGVLSTTFTPLFVGGRLDCIKDLDSIVRDAGRTKFVLDKIDNQPYEPPTDDAIKQTSYGYSNAFQLATVYCVGNSVVLMKANDSYNEYGIPGAFLSVFPILYSFFLMILVVFEKIYGNGRKLNDQVGRTTLLLGSQSEGYEPNNTGVEQPTTFNPNTIPDQ